MPYCLYVVTVTSGAIPGQFREAIPGQFRGAIPGTRTDYGCLSNFDGRPAFPGWRIRPTARSSLSTNVALPKGQPLRPCSRSSLSSSSPVALFKRPCQSATIASIGATRTNRSSRPLRCAFALLHGQSAASDTKPARTGLSSTYRAAASKYGSSITNEAKRPCHR